MITADHLRWAKNRQRLYGQTRDYYLTLIERQEGRCAFSGVLLKFGSSSGTPIAGGIGCHPLYASLDHCAPNSDASGHQIVSYALNDLKGHLPLSCFLALAQTEAWRELMASWSRQAEEDSEDREGFYALLRRRTA